MTREEAIEVLENGTWWDLIIPVTTIEGRIEEDKLHEALDIALAALRPITQEDMEKVWRGEWIAVTESELTGFNPELAGCNPIGGYECSRCKAEAVFDCNDEFVLDNFCPACGAAMTDEAMKMAMERLEALYEKTD